MTDYMNTLASFMPSYLEEAVRLRRALHKIPEAGFKETQTQAFIQQYLTELGYEPETLCKTGTAVFIPANDSTKKDLPGRALRSDMDGLCISEPESCEWRSEHNGFMHACGHDGHMAMLLLTAKILAENPAIMHGNVLLVFQPAEEGPGGAGPMTDSGIFERYGIEEIYGYHLFPFIEEGVVSTTPGPMMAMTSEFYLTIKGRATHAGNPELGTDALMAACAFVNGVQTIVSRDIARDESTLINVGTLTAGERMNIVPGEARITGTMRSYQLSVQETMKKRMRALIAGMDTMYETQTTTDIVDMYPPVINSPELYANIKAIAGEAFEPFHKVMLSEDFSMYQKKLKTLFMGLGCRNEEKGYTKDLHTDTFNFDEKVLLRGTDLYLKILQA